MRMSCMTNFEDKGQLSAHIEKVIYTLSSPSNLGSHGCYKFFIGTPYIWEIKLS